MIRVTIDATEGLTPPGPPHVQDGLSPFPDISLLTSLEDRARVFERMVSEGRAGIVQYHRVQPSLHEWMDVTAPDRAWLCAVQVSGREAGAFWITDFMGKAALFNFVVWYGYGRMIMELSRAACGWAFALDRNHYCLDGGLACLMGITPVVNRAAISALRASGWREVFRIPKACYIARLKRHVDGVLSHFTPELLLLKTGRAV